MPLASYEQRAILKFSTEQKLAGQQVRQAPPLGRTSTRARLNKADDRPVCFSGNRRYRRALALSVAKPSERKRRGGTRYVQGGK